MILIVKHIAIEGPGIFGEFFDNSNWETKTVNLDKGDCLPEDFSELEGVVVLGGPMNAYEEEKYPFLKKEDTFIRKIVERDIPIMGVCLGAQLLAKACDAKVKRAPKKEIGWYNVRLQDDGVNDPLFNGLDRELDVFQWHEDTFDLPKGAVLLAASKLCKNQAFRFKDNAYGLQFHVEVTGDMIEDWVSDYVDPSDETSMKHGKEMFDYFQKNKARLLSQARAMCDNFSKIILARRLESEMH